MELCVDNPREGFADLFATHPSVDQRVQALVKYAGGHDPGPLALPSDPPAGPQEPADRQFPPPSRPGPWGDASDPAGPHPVRRSAVAGPWGSRAGPWGRR